MNVRDLTPDDDGGREPPGADVLAGEYVLGVLDAPSRADVRARIERDPGFARLVADWETRFAPWLDEIAPVTPPTHVWPRLRGRVGWSPVDGGKAGLWNNAGLWRTVAGLATAAALALVFVGRVPEPVTPVEPPVEADLARPVVTLAHDDGTPGWLASVDPAKGTVLMVPVPAAADGAGRVPELWLIPAGGTPKSLGIVSIDRSHTVQVPDALREGLVKGSLLAITLEPAGGAPGGVATGPVVAKGAIAQL